MRLTRFALFLAFLATCSVGRANITGWDWWDEPGGAIQCTSPQPTLSYNEWATTISGTQFSSLGAGVADITTDSPLDPTLILTNLINNDTDFGWTGYDLTISMNSNFTLSNADALLPNTWTATTIQPVFNGSQYVGYINFTDVPPVQIGDNLEFSYWMSFSGGTSYSFTQTMMPVPEPSSLALLGVGVLGLIAFRWRRRTA